MSTNTNTIKKFKTPELQEMLQPISEMLDGVDYILAGGSCADAYINQFVEENILLEISKDYDLFFDSEEEFQKA